MEFNINLFAPHEETRYFLLPDGTKRYLDFFGEAENVRELKVRDEWYNMELIFRTDILTNLYIYPIYTVSLSEDGVEKTYQGSCLLFYNPIKGDRIKANFELELKELR